MTSPYKFQNFVISSWFTYFLYWKKHWNVRDLHYMPNCLFQIFYSAWLLGIGQGTSLVQAQSGSASASPCYESHIWNIFMYVFFSTVSLVKTIINYSYYQLDCIVFCWRNIHMNILAEAHWFQKLFLKMLFLFVLLVKMFNSVFCFTRN